MSAGYKEYFIAIVFFLAIVIGSLPVLVRAQENVDAAANLMCATTKVECGCGFYKNPKTGNCDVPGNTYLCQCSGPHSSGFCDLPGHCKATSYTSQSGQGGGAPDSGLSQLMGQLGQMLQQLMKSDSGGGSGSGSGTTGSSGCTTYTQTSVQNSTDPCSYYVPSSSASSQLLNGISGTSAGTGAASDLLSSLIGTGSTVDANANSNSNSNISTVLNSTTGSVTPNSNTSTTSSVVATQALTPGTSATVSQNVFGSLPGISGDIQVLSGNRVTMLASNRDLGGNKQTSAFYGFSTSIGEDTHTVYVQVCSAHQWANNFLASIIPITYLDTLCTSHGYSIIPPTLAPAVPPPAPSPSPSVAPKATSTPPYLGPLKADIWVSPAAISAGSRTSLFWSASGVLSCKVSSPTGVLGSALSGSVAVGPLSQTTIYSIACQSATSTISKQATVTVQ